MTYNLARESGSRVVSVQALCTNCTVPKYEDLDVNKVYKIVTNSFMASGGDGFTVIRDNKMNHVTGTDWSIESLDMQYELRSGLSFTTLLIHVWKWMIPSITVDYFL